MSLDSEGTTYKGLDRVYFFGSTATVETPTVTKFEFVFSLRDHRLTNQRAGFNQNPILFSSVEINEKKNE